MKFHAIHGILIAGTIIGSIVLLLCGLLVVSMSIHCILWNFSVNLANLKLCKEAFATLIPM